MSTAQVKHRVPPVAPVAMQADARPLAWERIPGESRKAFSAFRAYRDAGEARSLARVGRSLGKSKTLMERWSSRWAWSARVAAYDDYLA